MADSRNANAYFVYACTQDQKGALQIPASTIKLARMDQQIAPNNWPTIQMPCYGVSVDADQNVWGFDVATSTRALVDKLGAITQPKVNGQTQGNNVCPAGDSCRNEGAVVLTWNGGFGLRNGTCPRPTYTVNVPGCRDGNGASLPTAWGVLSWDADTPTDTALEVIARSGDSAEWSAQSWTGAAWTLDLVSPQCLSPVLTPNSATPGAGEVADSWLQVEFWFKSTSRGATPRLKSFDVTYRCK